VNPEVTLPYWDFTIEGEKIFRAGKSPSYLAKLSPMFSAEWFGSVDADHHIENSRWKGSLMPKQKDPDGVQNSYGFIRSYWNNNNDEQVTRNMFDICGFEDENKPVPTCKSHYQLMNITSLGMFQILSAADGHGPMHVQTGGVYGSCEQDFANFLNKWGELLGQDMTVEEIEAAGYQEGKFKKKWGETAQRRNMFDKAIAGEFFHIYRSLWRSHMCAVDNSPQLLHCPETCDETVPFEECKCEIPSLNSGETSWENVFGCMVNSEENNLYFKSTMPEELLKDIVFMFANTHVKEGEMLESASPADILFWIIHPAIERLLAAKRIPNLTKFGKNHFNKWEDPNTEQWLQYSFYTQMEGENKHYDGAYVCTGHSALDPVLPHSIPLTKAMDRFADADGDGVVSNYEFYLALDPNNVYGNDYVFDHFNWDHCEEEYYIDEDAEEKAQSQDELLRSIIARNAQLGY
jgi:hypothetical protein